MDFRKIASRVASREVSPELAPFEQRHRAAIQKIDEGLEEYRDVYKDIEKLNEVQGSLKAKDYVYNTLNRAMELANEIKDYGDDFPVLSKFMAEQDPVEEYEF